MVLKSHVNRDPNEITGELVRMVRDQIGAFACFKEAVVLKRLPKTRCGKILRGTMRRIADGEEYRIPSTIDDPDVLREVEEAVKRINPNPA